MIVIGIIFWLVLRLVLINKLRIERNQDNFLKLKTHSEKVQTKDGKMYENRYLPYLFFICFLRSHLW